MNLHHNYIRTSSASTREFIWISFNEHGTFSNDMNSLNSFVKFGFVCFIEEIWVSHSALLCKYKRQMHTYNPPQPHVNWNMTECVWWYIEQTQTNKCSFFGMPTDGQTFDIFSVDDITTQFAFCRKFQLESHFRRSKVVFKSFLFVYQAQFYQ